MEVEIEEIQKACYEMAGSPYTGEAYPTLLLNPIEVGFTNQYSSFCELDSFKWTKEINKILNI